jgi:hypothetical protein
MKLLTIINELFGGDDQIYPFELILNNKYDGYRMLRYDFKTKDQIRYMVQIIIWEKDREGRVDFSTESKNPEHRSIYKLINTHDTLKVFNTIKTILFQHKTEFDTLIISSIPERMKFYEVLLRYFNIPYERINPAFIRAKI